MAVLEPDSDNKNSDFFVENTAYVPSIDEAKLTYIKEETSTTNSSEPLTDQIIKKNLKETRYLHMPSIALGAGIAISCLVLGIFLGNFIDEKDFPIMLPVGSKFVFSLFSIECGNDF